MKKLLLASYLSLSLLAGAHFAFAQNASEETKNTLQPSTTAIETPSETPKIATTESSSEKVPIEVFVRDDCRHCQDEKAFLSDLAKRRSDIEIHYHDLKDPMHYEHWETLAALENLSKVTPITLVGNTVIEGFDIPETTGQRIENLIDKSKGKKTMNFEEFIAAGGSGNVESVKNGTCDADSAVCAPTYEPFLQKIPLLGVVDLKKYSLPTLSLVLGFIDGFNPCAMWVLVTFLIVLAQAGSKKKMWQIAGLFILAETIMYFLILNVWFKVWDFVGLDRIVTPIVGIIAIGGGIFFLYEWKTSDGTCKVTNMEQRSKTSQKIKKLVNAELTFLTMLGVLGLAFSVNIIEFACSFGIPQAYTKILDMNSMAGLSRLFQMFLYIFAYMIDDFIVFGIALYSFEKIGITTKYSKLSNLIGGVLMMVLGLILIFEPSWLVF